MPDRLPVAERPLFFIDYDGTLAPIVDDPMQAVPHAEAKDLLEALAAAHPLWIITGRHLRDLGVLLGMPLQAVGLHGAQEGTIGHALQSRLPDEAATACPVGLHGAQEGTIGHALQSRLPDEAATALARLRRTLPAIDGLRVEEKGPTFALHYRGVADEAAVRDRIQAWLQDLPDDLEAIWGKKVVELRAHGLSKGTAVREIAAAHPDRTPIYLGDDVTDEDAFAALPDDALTVKVGDGDTRARYRLPDVDAVVAYLKRYV